MGVLVGRAALIRGDLPFPPGGGDGAHTSTGHRWGSEGLSLLISS